MTLPLHSFEERSKTAATPRVAVGEWVKIGIANERFWCRVCGIEADDSLRVEVQNDLVRVPLRIGDRVGLQANHVLEVATESDRLEFSALAASLRSDTRAALQWHNARNVSGHAATPKPQTYGTPSWPSARALSASPPPLPAPCSPPTRRPTPCPQPRASIRATPARARYPGRRLALANYV